jgi:hypothetical protein
MNYLINFQEFKRNKKILNSRLRLMYFWGKELAGMAKKEKTQKRKTYLILNKPDKKLKKNQKSGNKLLLKF